MQLPKVILNKILEWVLYSNLFIALCAAALVWETEILLGISAGIDAISTLVFFATLFLYGGHRMLSLQRIPDSNRNHQLKWSKKYQFAIFILTLLGGGMVASAVFHLNSFSSFLLLIPMGIISVLYELPIIRFKGKYKRLRDIGILKIAWITIVWSSITVLLPAFQYGEQVNGLEVITVFLMRAALIFSLGLSFDLRDVQYDEGSDLKTIPILYGRGKTIRLIIWSLVFYFLIAAIQFSTFQYFDFGKLASAAVTAMLAYRLIVAATVIDDWYYYPLFVDGIMILNFLLLQLDK